MDKNEPRAEIMIVDDSRETLQLLSRLLYKNGFDVRPVDDGQSAINTTHKNPPDLALLDISMSGVNGYEVCRWLKADPATRDIPVIFISALDDIRNKVKAFEVGAVDYITKPFKFPEVLARIETHLRISRKIRELSIAANQAQHRRGTESQDSPISSDSEEGNHLSTINTAYAEPVGLPLTAEELGFADPEKFQQIGHSLRNPIQSVTLTLTLLKKQVDQADPQIAGYLDRIDRNLSQINQIIAETIG